MAHTVLLVLLLVFTHLVIISTWVMIIDQKSRSVSVSWKYQQSFPKHRCSIDITVFGWKYHDIWFCLPAIAFMECFWGSFKNIWLYIFINWRSNCMHMSVITHLQMIKKRHKKYVHKYLKAVISASDRKDKWSLFNGPLNRYVNTSFVSHRQASWFKSNINDAIN